MIDAQRTRAKTLVEMAEKSHPFFGELGELDEKAAKKHLRPAVAAPPLRDLRERLTTLEPWACESRYTPWSKKSRARTRLKLGKIAQPLRVAVTGSAASPSIDVTLQLVGREQCLKRLDHALVIHPRPWCHSLDTRSPPNVTSADRSDGQPKSLNSSGLRRYLAESSISL